EFTLGPHGGAWSINGSNLTIGSSSGSATFTNNSEAGDQVVVMAYRVILSGKPYYEDWTISHTGSSFIDTDYTNNVLAFTHKIDVFSITGDGGTFRIGTPGDYTSSLSAD